MKKFIEVLKKNQTKIMLVVLSVYSLNPYANPYQDYHLVDK